MASTIKQTITNQTCLFKQQIRILLAKGVMSDEGKNVYVDTIIRLMNEASDKLFEQAEVAKSYPQEDALIELDRIMDLIEDIADFDGRLDKLEYLGRTDLAVAMSNVIHAAYKLEGQLKTRAFSNRKRGRNTYEARLHNWGI